MYGHLHQALFSYLKDRDDGDMILQRAIEQMNIEGPLDDFFKNYDDEVSFKFLRIICEQVALKPEEILYEAGLRSMQTFEKAGYRDVLNSLGDDLFTVLDNLDSLHDNLLTMFPDMQVPSIRPQRSEDGSLLVHYYSPRRHLAPLMMGALKAIALLLFNDDIAIHHRRKRGEKGNKHDVFHVFSQADEYTGERDTSVIYESIATQTLGAKSMNKLFPWHIAFDKSLKVVSVGTTLACRLKRNPIGLSLRSMARILRPIQAKMDFKDLCTRQGVPIMLSIRDGILARSTDDIFVPGGKGNLTLELLQQAGLRSVSQSRRQSGATAKDQQHQPKSKASTADGIESLHPDQVGGSGFDASSQGSTLDNMSDTSSLPSVHSLQLSATGSVNSMSGVFARKIKKSGEILLHGQFIHDEQTQTIFYAATPHVTSLQDLRDSGMALNDLPIHSHGREILFSSMFQSVSAASAAEFEQKVRDLDKSMQDVQAKKDQIDGLLQSILPRDVALSLARGVSPPAESYSNVSVLFSDIAGFTSISSDVPPTEVMTMLNQLFDRFDALAEHHGVYKVETIGDAYMVASGCPEVCDDHALRIGRFALEMIPMASSIISPLDGEPLVIRVGIHAGPLMAGVVGRARPRYCLFGDTVNVASRMESNGIPGAVQVTYRWAKCLPKEHDLMIQPRGSVAIKGKGTMKTFLLVGTKESGVINDQTRAALAKDCSRDTKGYSAGRSVSRQKSFNSLSTFDLAVFSRTELTKPASKTHLSPEMASVSRRTSNTSSVASKRGSMGKQASHPQLSSPQLQPQTSTDLISTASRIVQGNTGAIKKQKRKPQLQTLFSPPTHKDSRESGLQKPPSAAKAGGCPFSSGARPDWSKLSVK
eukprot:m.101766 g.101766  ORF g.101766 m.101766 type:complete len:873 (+) comp13209_c0_seq1:1025-3643(+)